MRLSSAFLATVAKALDMESARENSSICTCPLSLIWVRFNSSLTKVVSWAVRPTDRFRKSDCFSFSEPLDSLPAT